MIEKLKELILNKSFLLGAMLAVGIFSKYIFGPNNLVEQIDELFIYIITGQEENFSPEEATPPSKDFIKEYKALRNESISKGN